MKIIKISQDYNTQPGYFTPSMQNSRYMKHDIDNLDSRDKTIDDLDNDEYNDIYSNDDADSIIELNTKRNN